MNRAINRLHKATKKLWLPVNTVLYRACKTGNECMQRVHISIITFSINAKCIRDKDNINSELLDDRMLKTLVTVTVLD